MLMSKGADLEALDDSDQTPLHEAVNNGHVGMVKVDAAFLLLHLKGTIRFSWISAQRQMLRRRVGILPFISRHTMDIHPSSR